MSPNRPLRRRYTHIVLRALWAAGIGVTADSGDVSSSARVWPAFVVVVCATCIWGLTSREA